MDHDELAALVAEDLTVRQIAARVGRSPTNVRYWLTRRGLATTARARRRHDGVPGTRVEGECRRHGTVEYVVAENGSRRCVRCRSEAVTRARRRTKALLISEAGGACAICGYDRCAGSLHFHHVEPGTKRFAVGGHGLTQAVATLREEARKCLLLCSNCHAEVEAGLVVVPSGLGGWDSNPQPLD